MFTVILALLTACGSNGGGATNNQPNNTNEGAGNGNTVNETPAATDTPFPEKSIELIVPFNAGGVSDILARAFAEAANGVIDQQITIKNVGGGSGTVGNYELVKAKPDGYTWLWAATGHISSALHITPAQYTRDDFTIVNKAGEMAVTVVVPKNSPFQTLQDLIDHAKANPGEVTVGNPGESTVVALLAQLLEDREEIQLQHVPFQGSGPLLPAVLGNHVDVGFMNVPEISGQVAAGELRALAVLSENRVDQLPDVPTAKEQGVDVAGGASHFIVIPNDVPEEVVQKIDALTKAVYETDRFKELMDQVGYQIAYKNGADSLQEVNDWYETTEDLYRRLGRIE
ncbi:hypothetical protein PA598K_05074 [Paenibacillus sp. 598K]|nr:hypothetical protein PA598K_05074 [Paenibacillus sp. 598K]